MAVTITGDQTGTVGLINTKTAQNSTSGTSIDFTSIPAGVRRITVMFNGVSLSGTSSPLIQLGSGSATTSGYLGSSSFIASSVATLNLSSGFLLYNWGLAANIGYGNMTFTNMSGNVWAGTGTIGLSSTNNVFTFAGLISLSGALDRVRITTVNGTDTFDAGSINILYE